jgi:hypothetical protein
MVLSWIRVSTREHATEARKRACYERAYDKLVEEKMPITLHRLLRPRLQHLHHWP